MNGTASRADRAAFVIVLANHKGGVTKTTSTANLGALLAEAGRRVLIVDCDPQANLSEAFGWGEELPGERLEDLLAHPAAADRYRPGAEQLAHHRKQQPPLVT
jgi:chromosome partitioning protein